MTSAQATAFEEGTGSFFTASDFLFTVQAIGSTLVFVYVAWLCLRAYNDYGKGYIKANDMITVWFRGVFMMSIFLYLLVN